MTGGASGRKLDWKSVVVVVGKSEGRDNEKKCHCRERKDNRKDKKKKLRFSD